MFSNVLILFSCVLFINVAYGEKLSRCLKNLNTNLVASVISPHSCGFVAHDPSPDALESLSLLSEKFCSQPLVVIGYFSSDDDHNFHNSLRDMHFGEKASEIRLFPMHTRYSGISMKYDGPLEAGHMLEFVEENCGMFPEKDEL